MAITVSEFAPPVAQSVVPSNGSRAISTFAPVPAALPTFSPIYNIGALSRSPSPITIVPSIESPLRASRIAFTAALSASFSKPLPIQLKLARAAASVTRTASNAKLRSDQKFSVLALIFLFLIEVD